MAIIVLLNLFACSTQSSRLKIEIHGGAGRDIHDPMATIVQEQYVVLYAIRNVSKSTLKFNRVEEVWSFEGEKAGLTQTVFPTKVPWEMKPGGQCEFVGNTDGYTIDLHNQANGKPITLSIAIFEDDDLLETFITSLPNLKDLPATEYDLLTARTSLQSVVDTSKLPVPPLSSLTFKVK